MTVSIKDLEAFAEGWNRHDVDFLMTFMAHYCVFETSADRRPSASATWAASRYAMVSQACSADSPTCISATPGTSCRAIAACRSGSSRPQLPEVIRG